MIQVHSFTYRYPGTAAPALQDVDLHIPAGQFCALVGANGAGKSTLCYALSGFIPHFFHGKPTGSVRAAEYDVLTTPPNQLAGVVGLVFQNPFNQITGARVTVREEVAFGLENLGVPRAEMGPRIDEALAQVGLAHLQDRSPFALSGGQQQRLAIASILVMRPQVLILDEPTAQLDPVGKQEVFAALRDLASTRQTTILLAEHQLEWIAVYADRVVALANGRVVADGLPHKILASPAMLTYGIGETRFTQAARQAGAAGLRPSPADLPVTLDQAVSFFS